MQYLFAMRVKEGAAPITVEQRDMEVAYVRETYGVEIIRQIWSRTDVPGACLLIEAANESAARVAIEGLPLMKAGKLEIETFIPLQSYRGFVVAGK